MSGFYVGDAGIVRVIVENVAGSGSVTTFDVTAWTAADC